MIKRSGRLATLILATALIWAFAAGCGSSSSDGTTTTDDTTTTTDLSTTVPGDVVLSSPTASVTASPSISQGKANVGDFTSNDFSSKREAIQNLIAGEGECSFSISIPQVSEVNCYGPTINYIDHPNADNQDVGLQTQQGGGPNTEDDGQLPVGDTGFWNESEGTMACAAAKLNELVEKVASKVDNYSKIFGSMACAGKKESLEPPAVGAELDVKDEMTSNVSATGLTIDSAVIERQEDDSSGNAVYESTIQTTMEMADQGSQTTEDKTGWLFLRHIPTATDNSTNKGKIATKMSFSNVDGCPSSGGGQQGGQQNGGPGVMACSIIYDKSSATSVTYQFNCADFCGVDADPFTTALDLDPTDKWNADTNPDGWVHNWNYGIFNFDPSTGEGNYAYAWQAGAGDGKSRVLNVSVTVADDNSATGAAYYGYGPDVEDGPLGTISGFVYNWAGPNGAIAEGTTTEARNETNLEAAGKEFNKVQKQLMSRSATSTEFVETESFIGYAPSNAGTATAGDNFTYQAVTEDGTALNFSNDRTTDAADITSNLVDLSDMTGNFTMPTAPSGL